MPSRGPADSCLRTRTSACCNPLERGEQSVVSERRRPPVVVFMCIQNAGRSQVAEALFNRAAEGRALARSAGSRPGDAVHPVVVEAMAEVGIDLSAAKPKGLTPDVLDGADWV